MYFRDASSADAASLAAISMEVWVGTYLRQGVSKFFADHALAEFTTAKFEAILASGKETIIVSDNENGVDGFIRMSFNRPAPVPGGPSTEICTLYVQPRHHGKGLGKGLLREGLDRCAGRESDAVWLSVNCENTPALDFYAAQGFDQIGQTHFRIGDEAYINAVMRKKVNG